MKAAIENPPTARLRAKARVVLAKGFLSPERVLCRKSSLAAPPRLGRPID